MYMQVISVLQSFALESTLTCVQETASFRFYCRLHLPVSSLGRHNGASRCACVRARRRTPAQSHDRSLIHGNGRSSGFCHRRGKETGLEHPTSSPDMPRCSSVVRCSDPVSLPHSWRTSISNEEQERIVVSRRLARDGPSNMASSPLDRMAGVVANETVEREITTSFKSAAGPHDKGLVKNHPSGLMVRNVWKHLQCSWEVNIVVD